MFKQDDKNYFKKINYVTYSSQESYTGEMHSITDYWMAERLYNTITTLLL